MESITKITVRHELQTKFHKILKTLRDCPTNLDIATREVVKNKLTNYIAFLSVYTEAFWDNIALSKNSYSTFFAKRVFPVYDAAEQKVKYEQVPQKTPVDTNTLRLTLAERLKIIRAKYDLRDCMIQSLSTDYIDEGSGTDGMVFRTLDRSRYYEIVSQSVVNEIFHLLKKLELYPAMLHLFCVLISTREYTHLAMNKYVIEYMFTSNKNPFLDPEYMEIIHHCLFYGLYIYYREECYDRSYTSYKQRYIMDLDLVARLPQFSGPLDKTPYLPASLSSKHLYVETVQPTEYLIKPINNHTGRGFYTTQEFKARFEVFTDGIFVGMPVDKIYFSGSCIAACTMHSPLEALFGIVPCPYVPIHPPVELHAGSPDWNTWQNIFKNIYDYWTKDQRKALEAYFEEYYPSKNIFPTSATTQAQLLEIEDLTSDIDIIIDDITDEGFDKKTLLILDHIRCKLTARIGREPTEMELSLLKIAAKKHHKYYISGTLLKRSLEIFRMYGNNAIAGVSRFHFPIVRGTYDGNHVHILPSMLSYGHTGMFMDYRWSSSAKDTKDLVLKYYMRGGIAILNADEHKLLAAHIAATSRWQVFKKYAETNKSVISIMNPIFRPSLEAAGFWAKLNELGGKNAVPSKYIIEDPAPTCESAAQYTSRFGFNLTLRFTSGNLKPFRLWKVMAYVDALHHSDQYSAQQVAAQ
jgi:hypothetical protein